MSLLGSAQAEGIDICILTKENLSSELDTLSVSDSLKEELRAEVASGKLVVIPKQELSVADWNGTGYMIMDPETGAGAYMISGGLTGGEIGGGAVTDEVTLYMLLGIISSVYVQVATVAGIAATLNMMEGAPLITVAGGYILNALALVSICVTLVMVYELILAYTDYLATGDIDSANEVIRIANILKWEAIVTIFMQVVAKAMLKSGSGKGNGGGDKSIPYSDYDNIYQRSVHNSNADSVMLGKYDNGGPTSYIKQAGEDYTYFSLDDWNGIKAQWGLSDDDMFMLFNQAFLDDGINAGKIFKFSHNPIGDQGALGKEFAYLLQNGYIWDEITMTMSPRY